MNRKVFNLLQIMSMAVLATMVLSSCKSEQEKGSATMEDPHKAIEVGPKKEEAKAVAVTSNTPWVSSNELIAHGETLYKTNCLICHGKEGKGDGPAGKTLSPKPRNFVEGKWKKGGNSIALFKTVTEGIQGTSMASFKHIPVADRWALVHFIHSITKNKVADKKDELEAFGKTAK